MGILLPWTTQPASSCHVDIHARVHTPQENGDFLITNSIQSVSIEEIYLQDLLVGMFPRCYIFIHVININHHTLICYPTRKG